LSASVACTPLLLTPRPVTLMGPPGGSLDDGHGRHRPLRIALLVGPRLRHHREASYRRVVIPCEAALPKKQ
jgi:hypothetical protein